LRRFHEAGKRLTGNEVVDERSKLGPGVFLHTAFSAKNELSSLERSLAQRKTTTIL